ncbi:MAG: hypothetical protein BIFFINMI_03233 [Phycisphaerae bacterium]|nr:hypothetical protein [Phycisphaerae bacterium]
MKAPVADSLAPATIVVFGSSKPRPGEPQWQAAFDAGLALGRAGFAVANGGYGGTMAASAAGARQAGATTVGVTCDVFARSIPNEHILREVRTPDLHRRLQTLIDLGNGYLVLPGLTGTLVELAMVWELRAKRMMPDRPIVCLGDFWRPLIEQMIAAGAKPDRRPLLADSVDAAAAELVRVLRHREPNRT